jgi:hypothetical protein
MVYEIDMKYLFYLIISVVSIVFGALALISLRDKGFTGSMLFLNLGKMRGLFKILLWGMGVPLTFALGLTLLDVVYHQVLFSAVSGILFLVAFAALNYFMIRGSMLIRGWWV